MRKVFGFALIAGSLLAGSLGWNTAHAAQAGVCHVTGSVSLVDRSTNLPLPLNETPRKGAYKFIDTNIRCAGTLNAVYSVTAQGTTTGIGANATAGDDCNSAQNDSPQGIYDNKFTATKTSGDAAAPATLIGVVNFTRFGSLVNVAGNIDDPAIIGTSVDWKYVAELNFTPGTRPNDVPSPDAVQAAGCLPGVPGGVTSAILDGVAFVYQIP